VPLALFAALHWGDLLEPTGRAAMLVGVLTATLAGGLLLLGAAGATGRRRQAIGGAVAVALVVLSLVAAGIPLRLLVPDGWGDLVRGLWQGAASLPALRVR
jgi:hypothetical protein